MFDSIASSPLIVPAAGATAAIAVFYAYWAFSNRRGTTKHSDTPEKTASIADPPGIAVAPFKVLYFLLAATVIASAAIVWSMAPSAHHAASTSLDSRSTDLTLRALLPGSPLSCLDAIGNHTIEAACERILFSSHETLASAIVYVDVRLNQFIEAAQTNRSSMAGDSFERVRRAIEGDRYGLVAHVLSTRGCKPDYCPTLRYFRDLAPVTANLAGRTFDSKVELYSRMKPSDLVADRSSEPLANAKYGAPLSQSYGAPSRVDYPSSASIPAVSIMNAETGSASQSTDESAPASKPSASRRNNSRGSAVQPGRGGAIKPETPSVPPDAPSDPRSTR